MDRVQPRGYLHRAQHSCVVTAFIRASFLYAAERLELAELTRFGARADGREATAKLLREMTDRLPPVVALSLPGAFQNFNLIRREMLLPGDSNQLHVSGSYLCEQDAIHFPTE